MAVDEAMLEQIGRGKSLPTLRLYAWEPACLSLGHAQPYSDVDESRLRERGWDIVRRPTGGRAILHTDELTYSIASSSTEEVVAGSLLESYNRIATALLRAVRLLGMNAEAKPGAGSESHSPNPVCFEVPSSYEITVNGKKLVGSAQARRREGVLQHGSLPLFGDLRRITQGLVFPDAAARQEAGERLLGRATTVESVLGHTVSWNAASEAFVRAFEAEIGMHFEASPLSDAEEVRAAELVHEKYGNAAWTRRV
jgi:lipoate-protein ligase A